MVPLDLFLNSSTTPFQSGWFRLPAAPSLSQILTWSMKQARGIVMGAGGEHSEGSGQLQTGDLVLVENLKVCLQSGLLLHSHEKTMGSVDYSVISIFPI